MSRYDLTDFEWRVIEPLLPNKPRGVPRVDDRRVLNGIFWVLRSGAPWRDLPERYGPRTTCYNRFVRWRKAAVWDRMMGRRGSGRLRRNCGEKRAFQTELSPCGEADDPGVPNREQPQLQTRGVELQAFGFAEQDGEPSIGHGLSPAQGRG